MTWQGRTLIGAVVGRFINADIFVSTGQGILGNNMFAYCGNNPITNYDPNCTWTFSIGINANATLAFGASIGIGIAFDNNWNIAIQWNYSFPISTDTITIGTIDAGIAAQAQITNKDAVKDLVGPATCVGTSGGPSWYVSGDIVSDTTISDIDENTTACGAQISIDYVSQTRTSTLCKTNLLEALWVRQTMNINTSTNCLTVRPFRYVIWVSLAFALLYIVFSGITIAMMFVDSSR